ncbi:hypothetical protein [Sphingobium boeckii]|uniref:Uncharacterized protein n=1 Tax=Sphingobium boeckii TaxID=1082345 RepID=A0A7W9EEG9_9SPHN|nr:hypothetical protein [Sphingobium boeckii]MBB5686238.1 hypothetical protein [Sphingobium boeckii]
MQSGSPPPAPLPSAAYCAAAFALTYDILKQKSGDPVMTQGFADDVAALRLIAIEKEGSEPAADAAIAVERTRLNADMAKRAPEDVIDLKPCYRVKALGRGGE